MAYTLELRAATAESLQQRGTKRFSPADILRSFFCIRSASLTGPCQCQSSRTPGCTSHGRINVPCASPRSKDRAKRRWPVAEEYSVLQIQLRTERARHLCERQTRSDKVRATHVVPYLLPKSFQNAYPRPVQVTRAPQVMQQRCCVCCSCHQVTRPWSEGSSSTLWWTAPPPHPSCPSSSRGTSQAQT